MEEMVRRFFQLSAVKAFPIHKKNDCFFLPLANCNKFDLNFDIFLRNHQNVEISTVLSKNENLKFEFVVIIKKVLDRPR